MKNKYEWNIYDAGVVVVMVFFFLFLWKQIWLDEQQVTIILFGLMVLHLIHEAKHYNEDS